MLPRRWDNSLSGNPSSAAWQAIKIPTTPERNAVSTRPMSRFETDVLVQPYNLAPLTNLSGKWIGWLRERQFGSDLVERACF